MALDLLTRLDPLRRVRCPYCFAEFPAYRMHIKCGSQACQTDLSRHVEDPILTRALLSRAAQIGPGQALRGPWWVDPAADPRRERIAWLDRLILPASLPCARCGQPASVRICPACHHELPDRVVTRRAGSIVVFGPQAIGKTTYLTVLLEEIKKPTSARRLSLKPLTEEVRQRYESEYRAVTYGARDLPLGELARGGARRDRPMPTPSLEIDRRSLDPFVFEVRTPGASSGFPLLSLFDLAGEDWEMKAEILRREAGPILRRAQGLLLMIDPVRLPRVASQLELTAEEAGVSPADYVVDADKLAGLYDDRTPVRTPLAICLNKLDRWGPLLPESSRLHQLARSMLAETIAPEALDAEVHEEVRSALRRWGQEEFLDRLEADFPMHRFFACSALGDAGRLRSDLPPPLPNPVLVERPAVWLLRKQGLLR